MREKVLLITGKLAEDTVEEFASESEVDCEIEVLPASVASFMSENLVLKRLRQIDLDKYSMILVPGLTRFNLGNISKKLNAPIYKGPRYASDIPLVLKTLDKSGLSMEKAADELLESKMSDRVEGELKKFEETADEALKKPHNFSIGHESTRLAIGRDFPPRIVAEIPDAPLLTNEEITQIAQRYAEEGAEIIDIGMVADEEMPQEIPRIASNLRKNFNLPLSIDSLNKKEIEVAIENEIDMIVSISGATIDKFKGLEVPVVLVPVNPKKRYYPQTPAEKLEYLEELVNKAKELEYENVIADSILEPVGRGFSNSMNAFHEFREKYPEIPIFMGIGNVVELYDADSIGMTALLVGAASEIGANLILTVEASDKTINMVSESVTARNMMMLAEKRGSTPKDLGLNLLKMKEKRRAIDSYDNRVEEEAKVIEASASGESSRDSKGFFRIFVEESKIVTVFHGMGDSKIVIKGEAADEICQEIVKRGLVSEHSHAAYLGRELQKAEIALYTGRGYIQEKDLF